MIAQELEVSLHMAFVEARQKQHEFITVEHLLLAMLDNTSAAEVLKACGVDLDELRGVLSDFIQEHTPRLAPHSDADTQPTQGFQRVIQRAILHVQSSCKKEVTGANVLVAIFGHDMVLQRQQPVPVWGWAAPGATVTVKFAGQSKSTHADAEGKALPLIGIEPASLQHMPVAHAAAEEDHRVVEERRAAFVDGLHLAPKGYENWRAVIADEIAASR